MALVLTASYVIEGQQGAMRRGLIERVMRYIPLQSVKIVVVVWQILTQVGGEEGSGSINQSHSIA